MPREPATNPYISVVVAARNDNHGGNMLRRMQAFVDSWIGQSKRYDLSSEMIIVEWNPPSDCPRLIDSLQWPAGTSPCKVRFVEVPPRAHERFKNPDRIPLHQMVAKNAGIRRADGEFVLATNLDIIFSAELMRFLAERQLEPRRLYRIDRHDVATRIPAQASLDELLAYCEHNPLRVFASEGQFELARDGSRLFENQDITRPDSGIYLGPGWYPVESYNGNQFRWIGAEAEIRFQRPPTAAARMLIDAECGPSAGRAPLTLEIVDPAGSVLTSAKVEGRCQLRLHMPAPIHSATLWIRVHGGGVPLVGDSRFLNLRIFGLGWDGPAFLAEAGAEPDSFRCLLEVMSTKPGLDWESSFYAASASAGLMHDPAHLHTNACGDFTLLSREDWFALRGYSEFPIWPMHVDSILCYAAHHAGIREVILREPMRIFHIEHSSGAGWTPEGEQELNSRIESKGVSVLQNREVVRWIDLMRRFNAPAIFTQSDWGLGDVSLPETNL